MTSLIALFVRRPVFTWVLVLTVVVLGVDGLARMPVERFPNVDVGYVTVSIAAPGLSSEQVESEIATRVENALGTVSGLKRLDSTSLEGQAVVTAQFQLERNQAEAANDVRDRVARLADELPALARPARIETFNLNTLPIFLLALDSGGGARTPIELTELADTIVRRELQSIDGVGEVRLVGGESRAYSIVLDPLRLRAADLSPQEVRTALERANLEAPGGTLAEGGTSLGLRLAAKARTPAELEDVILATRGDLAVRLGDVGRVEDGSVPSESHATLSGRPTVVLSITKRPGANTVAVADAIHARLAAARAQLPDGTTLRVLQDNSEDVRAAVTAVTEHLVLGALFAAGVVLLFLRSWRATLIAALAIPASVLGTFFVARALGVTLNLLSLLGLTLAVGIVIDDAIVVVENVVRVMHVRRLAPADAAVEATREIALAVLATTLSLVAVFLPVATMNGVVGRYLAPFGLTMSASILLSMGIAFTLTPMLSGRWLMPDGRKADGHAAPEGPIYRVYGRALDALLRRRWVAAVCIALALAAIVPLGGAAPITFLPTEDAARFAVYVRLPESVDVERTAIAAEEIAARVRRLPDVKETLVTTTSQREATVTAYLGRRGVQAARIAEARDDLRKAFPDPALLLMVGAADDGVGPDSATIQFVVRGAELDGLRAVATRLLERARKIPGTVDHGVTSETTGRRELAIHVDRARASRLGITNDEIGRTLVLADRLGVEIGGMRDPASSHDLALKLRLRVGSDLLANEDLVRALTVRGERGMLLPLSEVATIERSEGPGTISRVGRERQITLFMNTTPGVSDADVIGQIEKTMREIEPTGRYRGEVVGNAEEMQGAVGAFGVAITLSFVFMYLVLAAQFESWLHPLTILVSLPLTIPFGLLALVVGGQSLNVFSALGFLVLFGVVKKNSILQVDRILQLRAEGRSRRDAVLAACRDRLRPILMTTLAFVVGMVPLLVSSGPGAATNRAIGVGIFGGQTLSLALTLLVTPIVYTWFDDAQTWWIRRRTVRDRASAATAGTP